MLTFKKKLFRIELRKGINQFKTLVETLKRKEIKLDMEDFLNKRLQMLERVLKEALNNNNYSLALNIHTRIDEIKELLYMLENGININDTEINEA